MLTNMAACPVIDQHCPCADMSLRCSLLHGSWDQILQRRLSVCLSICRAETIRSVHDMIRYTIWCTRYDMFCDTFAILTWEAEACDPGLRSEALHCTCYNCLCSNDAQWLQQWRPPRSFQMQCVCDEFTIILLEYTDCYMWYLVFVSNFGMCYICTISYRIVLRTYGDTYCSLCIGDIPVCRCIVSALSVRHTFFTMFPSSHHPEIFRSYYQWQMWCPCKRSRSEVKGQGHRGHDPT